MGKGVILVAVGDASGRARLRHGLEADGWTVIEAATRAELAAALRQRPVDLVTLAPPFCQDTDPDLARKLRADHGLPVLMIPGQGKAPATLPPIPEVLIRIDRMLQRPPFEIRVLLNGRIAFDHSSCGSRSGTIRLSDGTQKTLTRIEQQILDLFLRHPGQIVSRDDLCQAVHGRDWSPFDRSIDGHVARLRRKLEAPGTPPALIRSVRSMGYVFTGEVRPGRPADQGPGSVR